MHDWDLPHRPLPRQRCALALAIAALAAGCTTPGRDIDRVRSGMSPDQVQSILGPPQTVAHAPGQECAYYTLLKDFWSRTPWSLSDRYVVCYDDGKVATFGKAAVSPSG
jgi:hypothetical protein